MELISLHRKHKQLKLIITKSLPPPHDDPWQLGHVPLAANACLSFSSLSTISLHNCCSAILHDLSVDIVIKLVAGRVFRRRFSIFLCCFSGGFRLCFRCLLVFAFTLALPKCFAIGCQVQWTAAILCFRIILCDHSFVVLAKSKAYNTYDIGRRKIVPATNRKNHSWMTCHGHLFQNETPEDPKEKSVKLEKR